MVERLPDPHGIPRPARGAEHVPLATSLYFQLAIEAEEAPGASEEDAADEGEESPEDEA